jgi:uncharacterized protein (TIGR02145 family)
MRINILLLLTSICFGLHSQTSYIQVVSEPGISVFLDATFKGTTTLDIGGLIIEKVFPGSHKIKVIKEGFNPQEEWISIKLGEVYSYTVKPFIPMIKISQQGNSGSNQIGLQVGKIIIQSIPVTISISIPELAINSLKKQDEWLADKIPVGNYKATFSWNNKILTGTIKINNNNLTHLFINMIKGEIEDQSAINTKSSGTVKLNLPKSVGTHVDYGTFTDTRDGIVYLTVQIGNQTWMAENLKTIHYSNGDLIGTTIPATKDIESENMPEYQWAYNGDEGLVASYGRLYTWYAVTDDRNVCPTGWHVPSQDDWHILIDYLGDGKLAYFKLKEIGNTHWTGWNWSSTNESGFTAIPGGLRWSSEFSYLGEYACYWSSTKYYIVYHAYYLELCSIEYAGLHYDSKKYGYSVRCIKD